MKSSSPRELLSQLVADLGQYEIPPEQLLPYIKVILEYTRLFPTPKERGEYLYPLLKVLQKNIRDGLDVIDAEANNRWSPNLRKLWLQASIYRGIRKKSFIPNWLP